MFTSIGSGLRSSGSFILQSVASVALVVSLGGCGNGANFNKIWGSDDKALDSLMAQAKIFYDKGEFDKAEDFASQAFDINKQNEEAAVLLGYINLSKGGIDPFILAKKLVCMGANNNDASKCTDAAASTSLTFDSFEGFLAEAMADSGSTGSTASSDTSASSSLGGMSSALSTIISISDADKQALGIKDKVQDSTSYFSSLPVYAPTPVTEDLRASVATLNAMNKAIKYVCPFVESGVFVSSDPRDTACTSSTQNRRLTYKSHFLWAFTHLTEAVVFQSVLLYSSAGVGGTSNLEARSSALNDFTGNVADFVGAVADLQSSVDAVFTTTSDGVTQLTATVNALTSVSNAFAKLPGMPSSISSQITKAIENLQALGKQVNAASETLGQSTALKAQMTEKVATSLKTTIDTQCQKQTCSEEDITKLCDSYDSITKGADTSKVSKPSTCS